MSRSCRGAFAVLLTGDEDVGSPAADAAADAPLGQPALLADDVGEPRPFPPAEEERSAISSRWFCPCPCCCRFLFQITLGVEM